MDIKIPNLGDGIESAIVISILVKPGDEVSSDQTLLELETDKAVAPVPSPSSGKIETISISEGDTVATGNIIGSIQSENSSNDTTQTHDFRDKIRKFDIAYFVNYSRDPKDLTKMKSLGNIECMTTNTWSKMCSNHLVLASFAGSNVRNII